MATLEYMTNQNAKKIARKMGNFIQVEQVTSPGIVFKRNMGVQVEINVEHPLLDGFPLKRPRKPTTWLSFKYKRISDFCYHCGCLGHIQQSYPLLQTQTEVTNFGPWMHAKNPATRRQNQADHHFDPQPLHESFQPEIISLCKNLVA